MARNTRARKNVPAATSGETTSSVADTLGNVPQSDNPGRSTATNVPALAAIGRTAAHVPITSSRVTPSSFRLLGT